MYVELLDFPPRREIQTIHEEPSSMRKSNKRVNHSLLTCNCINLPNLLNGGFIPLFFFLFCFLGNPYFVNKLRLSTLSIRIM